MRVLVDNDVIYKGCSYGLIVDLLGSMALSLNDAGVLASVRYVILPRLRKLFNQNGAAELFDSLLEQVIEIEPTKDEQLFAAELEYQAQVRQIALDSGESLLISVLISRQVPVLLTGDKKAVIALEQLLDEDPRLNPIIGKVLCLEQLLLSLLKDGDYIEVQNAICAASAADKAISICFGCVSGGATKDSCLQGLDSYVGNLRAAAGRILVP